MIKMTRILTILDDLTDDELHKTGNYPNINQNLPGGERSIAEE